MYEIQIRIEPPLDKGEPPRKRGFEPGPHAVLRIRDYMASFFLLPIKDLLDTWHKFGGARIRDVIQASKNGVYAISWYGAIATRSPGTITLLNEKITFAVEEIESPLMEIEALSTKPELWQNQPMARIPPILSIDIETGGPQASRHPLIAVGTCVRDTNGHKDKRIFRMEFDESKFDPECAREFWSKHRDILDKIKTLPISTIQDVADYIDSVDRAYPNLAIVSDNPAFDIGILDYHYDVVLNRKPLQYRYDGKYRIIVDKDSYMWAMMPESIDPWIYDTHAGKKYGFYIEVNHDHMPDNDAEHISDVLVELMKRNHK